MKLVHWPLQSLLAKNKKHIKIIVLFTVFVNFILLTESWQILKMLTTCFPVPTGIKPAGWTVNSTCLPSSTFNRVDRDPSEHYELHTAALLISTADNQTPSHAFSHLFERTKYCSSHISLFFFFYQYFVCFFAYETTVSCHSEESFL